MKNGLKLTGVICGVIAIATSLAFGQSIRVATYNMENLKDTSSATKHNALKQVIAAMNADIIGIQEVRDRAALEKVFTSTDWHLVIDDQASDRNLAVAVKKPLTIVDDQNEKQELSSRR